MNKPKSSREKAPKAPPMAIAVRPEDSIKPPPTKRELLEATAMVIWRDNVARHNEAEKLARETSAALDAAIHAYLMGRASEGKVNRDCYSPGSSHISVELQFKVPNEGPLKALADAAYEARGAVRRVESYEQTLCRLRKAQPSISNRVTDILAAPGVAEALTKVGRRMLGLAEASKPSVDV